MKYNRKVKIWGSKSAWTLKVNSSVTNVDVSLTIDALASTNPLTIHGTKYSRMDQVKIVEHSL